MFRRTLWPLHRQFHAAASPGKSFLSWREVEQRTELAMEELVKSEEVFDALLALDGRLEDCGNELLAHLAVEGANGADEGHLTLLAHQMVALETLRSRAQDALVVLEEAQQVNAQVAEEGRGHAVHTKVPDELMADMEARLRETQAFLDTLPELERESPDEEDNNEDDDEEDQLEREGDDDGFTTTPPTPTPTSSKSRGT